jgi:hypothetical protein
VDEDLFILFQPGRTEFGIDSCEPGRDAGVEHLHTAPVHLVVSAQSENCRRTELRFDRAVFVHQRRGIHVVQWNVIPRIVRVLPET